MVFENVPHEHVEVLPCGGLSILLRWRTQRPKRIDHLVERHAVRLRGLAQRAPTAATEVQAKLLQDSRRARIA